MLRPDYFRILEELSALVHSAVSAACHECERMSRQTLCNMRLEGDRKICMLEESLFVDFVPPLERESIAAYAHCLSRAIDRAIDYHTDLSMTGGFHSKYGDNEEGKICVELSGKLCHATALLRKIKKSDKMPDLADFRETLHKGREAHNKCLSHIGAGSLPRSYGHAVLSAARLRRELSLCFDKLVEMMLDNI